MIIGISGVARSGKDTLCNLLIEQLNDRGLIGKRFALADKLKDDLDAFLYYSFGISAFTNDSEEKDIIRPLLVAYGGAKRLQSKGRYWIESISNDIKEAELLGVVPIITDIRYQKYHNDECHWIKNEMNGVLIHVSRYKTINGRKEFFPPPNEDEKYFDPIIKNESNYQIEWPDAMTHDVNLKEFVDTALKNFLNEI